MTFLELLIAMAILALLAAMALGAYKDYRERARIGIAISDINALSMLISRYVLDNRTPPASLADIGNGGKLDPWGNPYYYTNLTGAHGVGQARKDKNLNPLNSDFDLYSVGKDGRTQSSLMAPVSRDDVIRARDGSFVGLASDFDP